MKHKKLKVGILGVGEIGSSIATLVKSHHHLFLKDLKFDQIKTQPLDVLHICIPYSKKFIPVTSRLITQIKPKLVIIESTVPLKTTQIITKKTKSLVVHSPVRGVHPNLVKYLKTFVKFIGPTSTKAGQKAKNYYRTLGIKSKILNSSLETELGKLLDTTYYALCIAWHQEMDRFCQKHQINFDQAVTQFNQTYNQGYQNSKPNVIRPVLSPNFIGGHCLIPNTNLLKLTYKSSFLNTITRSNQQKKRQT